MGTDFAIPFVPPPSVTGEARVPLGDDTLEEFRKLLLQTALQLLTLLFGLQNPQVYHSTCHILLSVAPVPPLSLRRLDLGHRRSGRHQHIAHVAHLAYALAT